MGEALGMRCWIVLVAVLAGGCPASRPPRGSPVDPMEIPPRTADPGAPRDNATLPPVPLHPENPEPGAPGRPVEIRKKPGAVCFSGGECASGICEGDGCDLEHPGHCAARDRVCTRDAITYCGCDGKVFEGSSTCPGQRFAKRGACP